MQLLTNYAMKIIAKQFKLNVAMQLKLKWNEMHFNLNNNYCNYKQINFKHAMKIIAKQLKLIKCCNAVEIESWNAFNLNINYCNC